MSVTDSATPAHDGIGVSGRKCRVPGSLGCQRRRLKTVSRGLASCFRDSRRSVGTLGIVAISEVDLSFSTPCVANLRRED